MQNVVCETIEQYNSTALLLIDIGAFPMREMLKRYPERVKNIGIFEPGTVGIAAGLALSGITPTIYGISPFIVQRALEQLKLDFVYQGLSGNFITTGAAYDFSTLGYSHYCPEDVATLRLLPGMEILTPGTPAQFETLFRACRLDGKPSYFRMTDHCNKSEVNVEFGKAAVIRRGSQAVVITVAEQLDATLEACDEFDVTVLYYTTLAPFDGDTLRQEINGKKIFVSAPLYKGSLYADIVESLPGKNIMIGGAEIPLQVLRSYGKKREKDVALGLDAKGIKQQLSEFLSK